MPNRLTRKASCTAITLATVAGALSITADAQTVFKPTGSDPSISEPAPTKPSDTQSLAPSSPDGQVHPTLTAVRYPAYPAAKRIEALVPPRSTPAAAALRKTVSRTAVAQKAVRSAKPAASGSVKSAAAKPALPGRQALGGPVPTAKPKAFAKKAKASVKSKAPVANR